MGITLELANENFRSQTLFHAHYSPMEQMNGCGEDFAKQKYFSNKGKPKVNPKLPRHIKMNYYLFLSA